MECSLNLNRTELHKAIFFYFNSSIVSRYNCDGYDYIDKKVNYNNVSLKYFLYPIHRLKVDYNL